MTECEFEASIGWRVVIDEDILFAAVEEVGWSEDCQENYRDWVDYTFTRE